MPKGCRNLCVLGVIAALGIVLIGSAVARAIRAPSEVRISLSGAHSEVSPFDYDGTTEYGSRTVNPSFMLANTGTRDAYVIVYRYVNRQVLDRTRPIFLPPARPSPIRRAREPRGAAPWRPP